MKSMVSVTAVCLTATGSLLLAPQVCNGAETRTKEQCASLFHELNTSGDGKLTIPEVVKNRDITTALSAPSVWKKGYLTEQDFTPLCETTAVIGPPA